MSIAQRGTTAAACAPPYAASTAEPSSASHASRCSQGSRLMAVALPSQAHRHRRVRSAARRRSAVGPSSAAPDPSSPARAPRCPPPHFRRWTRPTLLPPSTISFVARRAAGAASSAPADAPVCTRGPVCAGQQTRVTSRRVGRACVPPSGPPAPLATRRRIRRRGPQWEWESTTAHGMPRPRRPSSRNRHGPCCISSAYREGRDLHRWPTVAMASRHRVGGERRRDGWATAGRAAERGALATCGTASSSA